MIRASGLSDIDLEFLLLNIQEFLRCARRNHLALWMQGQLQALLPHRAVIVAIGGTPAAIDVDYFGRESLSDDLLGRFGDIEHGIVAQAMVAWRESGHRPIFRAGPFHHNGSAPAHAIESTAELYGHGIADTKGQTGSFFVFFADEPGDRSRREEFLQILIPFLHAALMRVLGHEAQESGWEPLLGPPLTDRELEVLRWVQQGKSNASIASVLAISPLTVKNHVQSILKKLKAANRAQAVAFGIARRMIPPARHE